MLLITGATGHIGRRTAELLAQDRQLLRDPARAAQVDADIVHGDYGNPGSLDAPLPASRPRSSSPGMRSRASVPCAHPALLAGLRQQLGARF